MRSRLLLILVLALLAGACGPASTAGSVSTGASVDGYASATPQPSFEASGAVPQGDRLRAVEVGRRPHDPTAFTQGLEFDDGRLYESRGLYSRDEDVTLTEIDPADGSTLRAVDRDPTAGDYFAEGLTVVDDRIIQITWREQIAFVHDLQTLERIGTFAYEGEGWGICDEPDRLVMSDGTPTLTFRDLQTFEELGTVTVTLDGQPVERLNELECVGGLVWANVWQTDTIVVIDPDTGVVASVVDASGLLTDEERRQADVLNGIAYDATTDTWLLTGKLWPWMFEVRLECVVGCTPTVTPSHYMRPTDRSPGRT